MKNILLLSIFSISIGSAQIKVSSWYESIPTKQRIKIIEKISSEDLQKRFDKYVYKFKRELRKQEDSLRNTLPAFDSSMNIVKIQIDTLYFYLNESKQKVDFDTLSPQYVSKQDELEELKTHKADCENEINNIEIQIKNNIRVPKRLLNQTLYRFELNDASSEFDLNYYLTEKNLKEDYIKIK